MNRDLSLKQATADMAALCTGIEDRRVGGPGNRKAAEYVANRFAGAGLDVVTPEFECIDWRHGDVSLTVGDEPVPAFISPYSLSCSVHTSFEVVSDIAGLADSRFEGRIAVPRGDLCREQIMPKNFPFYNPDRHRRIVRLLEDKRPAAIVAITGRNPGLAGALYPFPLFEDGDFDIPSVYVADRDERLITGNTSEAIRLTIESERVRSTGCNVIGFKAGRIERRIVVCAHIDSKIGSPGALDNATGVAVLLTLADMLSGYRGGLGIELLAVNGEDCYASPGQKLYLAQNADEMDRRLLAVNVDGAALSGDRTTYCSLCCSGAIDQILDVVFSDAERFVRIAPWHESDHMLFVQNGVPAVAITSEGFGRIQSELAHTPHDTVDNVDHDVIHDIASAIHDLMPWVNRC